MVEPKLLLVRTQRGDETMEEEIDLEFAYEFHQELGIFINAVGFERLDLETRLRCMELLDKYAWMIAEIVSSQKRRGWGG